MVIMNMKEMLVEEKKLIMMKLVGVEEEEDGEEMEEEEEKMEEEEEDGEEMEGKEGESRHQGRFQKLIVCLVIEFLPLDDEYYDDVPALDPKNENCEAAADPDTLRVRGSRCQDLHLYCPRGCLNIQKGIK